MFKGKAKAESLPLLPLRDIVVFPYMIVPLFVGREASVHALEEAVSNHNNRIILITQKDSSVDEPSYNDVYPVGTLGNVLQLLKLPDGTVKVLVEGLSRVRLENFIPNEDFLRASFSSITELEEKKPSKDTEALARAVLSQFEQYVKLNRKIAPEILISINQMEGISKQADVIAAHINLKIEDKQRLLETKDLHLRLELLFSFMESEIGVLFVEKKIRRRVKKQMEKNQRDYYLNEQMKAIQNELGEVDEQSELQELEDKIKKTKLSPEAREKANAELKKLKMMSLMSSEASVIRNYLDWLISIPWNNKSKIKKDITAAQNILDKDHYGLEKVKERITENLAVQQNTNKIHGPILCLVGPPGVGKTSLGQSIAKATGRNFVRISLGGMRDEAEIRGHRKTYIGSLPGKIIQSMKKAKTSNPLFLLDEIDKLGNDWRGDPSSALLEVLDPEQNKTFNDHYLEVDYDLSDVLFITTANTLKMPRPLLDRMEIIDISGYTEDEKLEIAKRHLIPKQLKATGLTKKELVIKDEAIRELIRTYTREAGVRNLEREIAKIARKGTKELLTAAKTKGTAQKRTEKNKDSDTTEQKQTIKITAKNLEKYAGIPKYTYGVANKEDLVGVSTGLAWTEVGGDILSIEALTMYGNGKIALTGQLGDVMKESIEAAYSFVRSNALSLGIRPDFFAKHDIHVHVPEGATPKDGPSAGIAIFTALVSALTGIPVRKDVAMTGEITLIGRVLPIGGLKEKLLAALRGGLSKVIIPKENEKDLADIPDNVKEGLEIIPLSKATDVLPIALERLPIPISEEEWENMERESKKEGNSDIFQNRSSQSLHS